MSSFDNRAGRFRMLAIAVISVAMLGGCIWPPQTTIEIEIGEGQWEVTPDQVGDEEIVFRVTNTGTDAHQPVVIRTHHSPDELPTIDGIVDLSNIFIVWPGGGSESSEWPPDHGVDELFLLLEPGASVEDAPVKRGEGGPGVATYVVFCNLPGHYEAGEFGSFEVTAAR